MAADAPPGPRDITVTNRSDGGTVTCTVSVGVSRVFTERQAWETALRQADAALYAAKQAGRNRVVVAPPDEPVPA